MKAYLVVIFAGCSLGQVPVLDQTTLNGRFNFIYGLYQRSSSSATMGTITFDGKGYYTLAAGNVTSQGVYRIDIDGLGVLSNPFDPTLPAINLRVAAGARMFGGSTLNEGTADRHDMFLALPAASKAPSMTGNWGGVTFLYTPGPPTFFARAGRFRFSFDASGNVNSTSWTFHESDISGGAPQNITSTGTYSVDASGLGTYSSAQGSKRIAASADGTMYIGIDAGGLPELIFGTRLADGTANSPGLQGRYWWYQLNASPPAGGGTINWALINGLQGMEGRGLNNGSGWGQFIDGGTGRVLDLAVIAGGLTIHADSTLDMSQAGLGTPGIGAISADNAVLPWTNLSASAITRYSFSVAVGGPSFKPAPGQTVFLDPNGPMQAATASAHPFPLAPGTLVVARGSGLATGTLSASGLPLPTSLGSTSLTANGQPVGLLHVAPDAITFLMPWATGGAGKIKLKATVAGVDSNEITVRSAPTSVGYFSAAGDGIGAALATHADGSPINDASPASRGEAIVVYASGLGMLSSSVAEYDWARTANSTLTTGVGVQPLVNGVQSTLLYAGAAPGFPGVYQVNFVIPQSTAPSSAVTLGIYDGYSYTHPKVTIPVR